MNKNSDQTRFCLRQNRSDLRGQPLFASKKQNLKTLFGDRNSFWSPFFLFRSATFFPSQNRFAFLIHPFPPENLLTVNFRLCKTAAHVRRFAKTFFRPSAKFRCAEFRPDLKDKPGGSAARQYAHSDRKEKLVFSLQQVFCRKARQRFFSLKNAMRF